MTHMTEQLQLPIFPEEWTYEPAEPSAYRWTGQIYHSACPNWNDEYDGDWTEVLHTEKRVSHSEFGTDTEWVDLHKCAFCNATVYTYDYDFEYDGEEE